jgi:hypothetical protein
VEVPAQIPDGRVHLCHRDAQRSHRTPVKPAYPRCPIARDTGERFISTPLGWQEIRT